MRRMTAFENVSVVPMDEEVVLENQTVLVEDRRIVSVEPTDPTRSLPPSCQAIDGTNSFLAPGLADMHAHLDIRDPDPVHLILYLAEGVTTVRSLNGTEINARWRDLVSSGDVAGPTVLTAGRALIGGLPENLEDIAPYAKPVYVPRDTEDAVAEVNRQADGWADLIKVYDGLPPETYLAAISAANERGAYVIGHALDELPLETILKSGINEIAHTDELSLFHWIGTPDMPDFRFDYEAIPNTVATMAEEGVALVSNLVADETMIDLILDSESVLSRSDYKVVRPKLMDAWRRHGRHLNQFVGQGPLRRDHELPFLKELLHALQQAGVVITIGTDTSTLEGSVPSQIHRDLELLTISGFTAFEAMSAATRNAGAVVERMGGDGRFGTITPGQRADLAMLRSNPLQNVRATKDRVGVMANGVWRTQEELDQAVAQFLQTFE